ncbi:cb4bacb7-f90a-427c-a0e5-030a4bf82e52 [Thermothielavioides terrestris]|uniref:Cb4bacb7-f90a-427c-a0e5-030a4bf82e52 n=1 Tax=Thermothielavioides terrestris TaxID=2587410 RepID=A0A3S4B795_9PEZI|nr:cb4bacb7-f90a-427c-a0e5-030a4bf82e52 [Thermothielavioides terrestris]
MSSSLPVPSKAALTALRGLAVGTTCTLALVVEDRRRKINNALRVIENGQKIKSAKRYRAGGGALAVALEEEALWDPGLLAGSRMGLALQEGDLRSAESALSPTTRKSSLGDENNGGVDTVENMALDGVETESRAREKPEAEAAIAVKSDASDIDYACSFAPNHQRLRNASSTSIQDSSRLGGMLFKSSPRWFLTNTELIKRYAFPTIDEIVAQVHEACRTRDGRQIATALRNMLEVMGQRSAPDNLDQSWIEASALLCRTCQEEGMLEDAMKLLLAVIARGPLEESAYLRHEPFALIRSLLGRTELSEETRSAYQLNLDAGINLFLPTFTARPTDPDGQMYVLGRELLELSFSMDRLQRIFGMYRRCNLVAGERSESLTSWFLTKLYEKRDYKSVVKVFLSTYAKSSPTAESLHAIGDMIVESVELGHNYRPEQVLKTLHSICSDLGDTKLSSHWVIKLLVSHWKQHHDFQAIETLFQELQTPSLKDSVYRSDNIYRIMVELALEAGERAKADSYFAAATAANGALASDVRLLGVFARFRAKDGDWAAVRATFEAMKQRGRPKHKAYGQVFVPVLKAYADTHTVRETEAFLKSYADELEVPLCSYMVTLMAKQYGAARDVRSLISWLDYSSRAGFPVDAAFTNAILVRCRRQWKFPFRDLRTLYRKLRALNPDFVDKHTEQVMADAALLDSKHVGCSAAKGRLLSLRVDPNKLSFRAKGAQVEDLVFAMKEALAVGCPRRAVWLYKRALHLGMPFSQQTLRLAVQARLRAAPTDYHGAYALIQAAQAKGQDVHSVINQLLAKQLGEISCTTNPTKTYETVRATLAHYRNCGIPLKEPSLHRAALTCLSAGHIRGAITYALEAAEVRGGSAGPCFDVHNFKILLAAYAELVDVAGLQDTVDRALASDYKEDSACRTALRHARVRVAHSRAWGVTLQQRMRARAVLDEGIRRVVEARRRRRDEGKLLEAAAMRIMRRAALDAGWKKEEKKGSETGDEDGVADGFLGAEYFAPLGRELDGGGAARVAAVEAF